MHKIWIIIQREYTSRVKNKRFLIVTFLVPLLMVGLIVGSAYFSFKGTEERKIAVVDPNGFFKDKLKSSKQLKFEFPTDVDTSNYKEKGYSDILLMPLFEGDKKADYILRSKKSMGFTLQEKISSKINAAIPPIMAKFFIHSF